MNQTVTASPPTGPTGSRRRSRRLLFKLAITCLTLLLSEICGEVICRVRYGSPTALQELRHDIAVASSLTQGTSDGVELPVVIHPYQGVVTRPTSESDRAAAPPGQLVGTFGFRGIDSPNLKRSDDQLIVAVVGGSVARQFVDNATESLQNELATHPKYRDRTITILPLAVDGYKQPQQLTMLAYLMTLGAEFDIVINLDGLNEVALPAMDNVPMGVFSAFPRQWGTIVAAGGEASRSNARLAARRTCVSPPETRPASLTAGHWDIHECGRSQDPGRPPQPDTSAGAASPRRTAGKQGRIRSVRTARDIRMPKRATTRS